MAETITATQEIGRIVQDRRSKLSDAHVTDYNKIDENGDKIREETVQGPQGTTQTVDVNVSHLFQDAPSRTGDVSIIVLEAELADDGTELANPHVPTGADTLESALDQMETKGLTPAWEL